MAGAEAKPSSHFSDVGTRKSVLMRRSYYRDNTKGGFTDSRTVKGSRKGVIVDKTCWEAHHIICEHAIGDREFKNDPAHEDYVEACLWVTDWDLNNKKNMIGLPLRKAFKAGFVNQKVCCHQNDHNTTRGYTEECKDFMQTEIWDKLKKGQKFHTTDPKDIADLLIGASRHFDKQLKKRAKRNDGTVESWTKRHDTSWPKHKTWYLPLSMAKTGAVVKRSPGAKASDPLNGVFSRI